MRDPLLDALDAAASALGQVLRGVTAEQWSAPTPCDGWTVRDLVGHVVAGNRQVVAALRGAPAALAGTDAPDPVDAYESSAGDLAGAFGTPGALAALVTVPFGTVPGRVAAHLRITELLVHGWDLARATGHAMPVPEEFVLPELEFTRQSLPTIPAGRSPFKPSRPAPTGASPLDRLAALLGRPVGEEVRVAGV